MDAGLSRCLLYSKIRLDGTDVSARHFIPAQIRARYVEKASCIQTHLARGLAMFEIRSDAGVDVRRVWWVSTPPTLQCKPAP